MREALARSSGRGVVAACFSRLAVQDLNPLACRCSERPDEIIGWLDRDAAIKNCRRKMAVFVHAATVQKSDRH